MKDLTAAFRDPSFSAALFEDTREDYGGRRMVALRILNALVVLIVHLEFDDTIRIISMRKGDKNETRLYYQNLGAV